MYVNMKNGRAIFRLVIAWMLGLVVTQVGICQANDSLASMVRPQQMFPIVLPGKANLRIYAQCATEKVFTTQDLSDAKHLIKTNCLRLAAARNETELVQLVLRPTRAIKQMSLVFKPLRGPGCIAESSWSWRRVLEVNVPKETNYYGLLGQEKGMIPDPLSPGVPFTAPGRRNSVLLLQVAIPADAPAGTYKSEIQVLSGTEIQATIPVSLEVWDITLPRQRSMATIAASMGYSEKDSRRQVALGVTHHTYGARGWKLHYDRKTGALQFNLSSDYENSMRLLIDELGAQAVALPPSLLGLGKRLSKSYLSSGVPVGSEKFWPMLDQFITQMRAFYVKHGWQDNVYWYIMDEIHEMHYPTVAKIAARAKKLFPELHIFLVAEKMPDELAASLDGWVVPWHFFVTRIEDVQRWDELRHNGLTLYAYMNSLYFVNASWNPGAMRFYGPVLAKYGYRGALWWGLTQWGKTDPWKELLPTGVNEEQNRRMYGQGGLLYPPRETDPEWRSSLRWENYRQGIEDYELMMELARRWRKAAESLGVIEGTSEAKVFHEDMALRSWGSLLSLGFRVQSYRKDSAYIHRFRQLLAHEISNLLTVPVALIDYQTDGGWCTRGDTVHIRGLVQAGARVRVGEYMVKQFSAKKPYIFTVNYKLKLGLNVVPITIIDDQGHRKTMYREIVYRPM